jgi:hypothetical protein
MHVALSWDINASGARWTTINDALRGELKNYAWVRPLATFYIVNISTAEQRDGIVDALSAVARRFSETINFVVTPPMIGGGYNGWLPKDLWDKINERAK